MTIKTAEEILKEGKAHNSIVVMGAMKNGKTSFTCSGSRFAGPKVKAEGRVDASDVVIINIDAQGYLGAVDCGYNPRVIDLSGVQGWSALDNALAKAILEIKPLVEAGEVSIVGVDLGAIAKEALNFVAGDKVLKLADRVATGGGETTFAAKEIDWNKIAALGLQVYRGFRALPCTVVANCHVKLTDNNHFRSKMTSSEQEAAKMAKDVASVGGEAALMEADIYKGIIQPWYQNANHTFARDIKKTNIGTTAKPVWRSDYVTYTSNSDMFTVGSRRASVLPPETDMSLRALLELANKI